jgi:pyruvate formate lyase activating enzyme
LSETEALHYERRPDGVAACRLCPHRCEVAPGARGRCDVRENLGGILYVTSYDELTSLEPAPVEAIPLFHFRPGARFLALGSIGDSFPPELAAWRQPASPDSTRWATAQEVIDIAVSQKVAGIACAGGEPFMWLELWREVAAAARAEKLASVAVTNGYALAPARADVAPLLDAVNITYLGPAEAYRRRGLEHAPVVETALDLQARGVHVELTLVVLPGENDAPAALADTAALAARLGGVALHVTSAVHFETAATVKTMQRAAEHLRARAPHVYLSGMYGTGDATTRCAACQAVLVERHAGKSSAVKNLARDGTCAACGSRNAVRL